jgi:hypothetical protein
MKSGLCTPSAMCKSSVFGTFFLHVPNLLETNVRIIKGMAECCGLHQILFMASVVVR